MLLNNKIYSKVNYITYETMRGQTKLFIKFRCYIYCGFFLMLFILSVHLTYQTDKAVTHEAWKTLALERKVKLQLSASENLTTAEILAKPWFIKNGLYYPQPRQNYNAQLLPQTNALSDRIIKQLMYVPPNYMEIRKSGKLKMILLYHGIEAWHVARGRHAFVNPNCPVDTCEITTKRRHVKRADLILYKNEFIPTRIYNIQNPKQIKMLYYLESPHNTHDLQVIDAINWTATYRRDSDVVTPYEKWWYYNANIREAKQQHNYALHKTKQVAWFVSDCHTTNARLQYAHELQKYINVDIYGNCGNLSCSRSSADECFEMLESDYKFYLAFENSNCRDYITEKFFVNALKHNILPIVMGASPEDYKAIAPQHSYIHVNEFASPKLLAAYLNKLDTDDELYNSYFKWQGTGEFINTYFWCRLCAVLHDEQSLQTPRWYANFNDWWHGPGICIKK